MTGIDPFVLTLIFAAIFLYALYFVIRAAVLSALRAFHGASRPDETDDAGGS